MNPNIETALLDGIITSWRKADGPKENFWMSSLGMCPRMQVAKRAGLPPMRPMESHSIFKMATGTVLGAWMQQVLEEQGYLDPAWHEKSVSYRSYRGRVDGYTASIPAIVEIKTCDDRAVKKDDVPPHYLWQGLGYCLATGIPALLILMVGKNQGLTKHRVITLTDEWKQRLEQEISILETYWAEFVNTQTLPSHIHRFSWEDNWCSYLATDGRK